MATSTFYDKIVLEKEAAKILANGLKGQKHPRPNSRENERKRGEELSKLYHINLAERAASRKADITLQHIPNENDLCIALEHAQLMAYPQYQVVQNERKC